MENQFEKFKKQAEELSSQLAQAKEELAQKTQSLQTELNKATEEKNKQVEDNKGKQKKMLDIIKSQKAVCSSQTLWHFLLNFCLDLELSCKRW